MFMDSMLSIVVQKETNYVNFSIDIDGQLVNCKLAFIEQSDEWGAVLTVNGKSSVEFTKYGCTLIGLNVEYKNCRWIIVRINNYEDSGEYEIWVGNK